MSEERGGGQQKQFGAAPGTPWRRKEQIGDATLYLGDCLEVLPTLGKVDAVVTDPPYGIGMAKNPHSNLKMRAMTWDSNTINKALIDLIISVSKNQIIWGGNYYELPPHRCFLFWDKSPMPPSYATGELAWTSLDANARKWCGKVGDEVSVVDRSHPTQKPIALMEWCLGFLPDAETILDPFMGSGTTGVACANLGRKFIGVEIEEKYFDIACKRIEIAYQQPRLFDEPRPKAKPQELGL